MNEALQAAVTELITKTITSTETGIEFLSGQLPAYVSQLLMWHGMYSFIISMISLVILFIVWYSPHKMVSQEGKEKFNGDALLPWQLLYLGSAMVSIPALVNANLVWLQIWLAPKVWLVEYAAGLVK